MGKSPGKWIKTLLFGKKSSKSNLSKGRDSFKSTEEEGTLVSAQAADSIRGPPDRNAKNSLENGVASNSLHNGVVITPGSQGADVHTTTQSVAAHNPERVRQEQAATKAQAAFRGYLARRAFRALRGIIRLQALVRGHLVRRQAIATLRCMQGIVKFQALIRGRRVRCSDVGIEVNEKCNKRMGLEDANHLNTFGVNTTTRREKLWANAFICKHVASSPTVMPLHLQYGLGEPNSAWSWLEVWSFSRIWEPLPHPKKVESKSQARPKRSARKVPRANVDTGSVRSSSESEKPKRNLRKVLSHPVDLMQESPPNDLEKVKRGTKKVSNSRNETVDRIEAESRMPKQIHRKASCSLAPDASNSDMVESSEKTMKEMSAPVSKYHDTESPSLALATNKTADVLHDDQLDTSPLGSSGKGENIHVTNGELISKQGKTSNENQKGSKRRASFPTKQEYSENGGYNSPKLPSYMQATESAKAKLQGLGSPKPGLDGSDQISLTRRHSLPSATNGKLSSLSPHTHKLIQANGKAGVKNDRSLMSSRDGNEKGVQAEWRR